MRGVAGEPLVAAVAPERGAGAPPTRLGEQESPGVRVGEIREVPKVGDLLGQRRRDGVVGSRVTHRQLPHPRHVIDPAPLVRGRACEVQRVRLESRPGYVTVANEPGGRPNDRRRVEPPAQEHGDRGDASEPTAHRLAKDLAEVLGVLVVRAIPDLAPRIDVEIACRADTTVLDGEDVARRQTQDPAIEGLAAVDQATAQVLTEDPFVRLGAKRPGVEKLAQLRAPDEGRSVVSVVKRPYPQRVARAEEPAAPAIPDREREIADDPRGAAVDPQGVGLQHELRVGVGP